MELLSRGVVCVCDGRVVSLCFPSVVARALSELRECARANRPPVFSAFLIELAMQHVERDHAPLMLARQVHASRTHARTHTP